MGFAMDASGKIRKAIRLSLNEMGRDWVKFVRFHIDTPYPPASDPGEYPHRRTRTLQKSIKYKVAPQATNIQDLKVFIDDAVFQEQAPNGYNYAMDLEYGRPPNLAARPFWRRTRRQISPHLQPWFERLFAKNMASMEDADPFDASDNAADFPAGG